MSHDQNFVVDTEFRGDDLLNSIPSQRCRLASTAVIGDLNEAIQVIKRDNGLVGRPLQHLLRRGNVGDPEPAPKDLDTPLAEFADAARKVRVVLQPPPVAHVPAGAGAPGGRAGEPAAKRPRLGEL